MSNDDLRVPEKLLPLTPAVFHILLALADGEKHGYAIMQEVGESTGGAMRMGPGTLYGSIQRMLKDGLIVEAPERPDPVHGDERRRYYRLTGFGVRVLQAEARRLEQLVQIVQNKQILPGPGLIGGI
ncbi:MAG TPA: PadR family transcriptional regulator [Ktedonobacteraceae bacterium]|jgi:DNA-binding PadR family transcriptional regulator|nr:PadR family transcriptional regulator [Ktedonobacteraceae bacterium]